MSDANIGIKKRSAALPFASGAFNNLEALIFLQMTGKLMSKLKQEIQKILVVDDEKNYRIILARLFEGVGYQVLLADSPESAMTLLQNEKVSLLLTDLQMARMNGLAFCQRVRSEIGDIPTIVFTANASSFGREALNNAGVLTCLDKPFDNQVILNLVADIFLNRTKYSCPERRDNKEQSLLNEYVLQKEPELS